MATTTTGRSSFFEFHSPSSRTPVRLDEQAARERAEQLPLIGARIRQLCASAIDPSRTYTVVKHAAKIGREVSAFFDIITPFPEVGEPHYFGSIDLLEELSGYLENPYFAAVFRQALTAKIRDDLIQVASFRRFSEMVKFLETA